jgi:hypothetical protein
LEFQQFFPPNSFRKIMGMEPLAFLWCLILNHCIADAHKERVDKIAYLVSKSEKGNTEAQLQDCHSFVGYFEAQIQRRSTGAIAFDWPDQVNALQAADMVAWSKHRHLCGEPFNNGYEPLELLTRTLEGTIKPGIHLHFPIGEESTRKLSEIIKAENPSLLTQRAFGFAEALRLRDQNQESGGR